MFLESLVNVYHMLRRNQESAATMLAREADDKNHLLRMALEAAGINEWERGTFNIPVTKTQSRIQQPVFRQDGFVGYQSVEFINNVVGEKSS